MLLKKAAQLLLLLLLGLMLCTVQYIAKHARKQAHASQKPPVLQQSDLMACSGAATAASPAMEGS